MSAYTVILYLCSYQLRYVTWLCFISFIFSLWCHSNLVKADCRFITLCTCSLNLPLQFSSSWLLFYFPFLLYSFYHLKINPFSFLFLSLFFLQFICLYPSDILSWIILLTAAVASSIFLLRNLAPIIISQAGQQSALLLGAIGYVTHFHFPL